MPEPETLRATFPFTVLDPSVLKEKHRTLLDDAVLLALHSDQKILFTDLFLMEVLKNEHADWEKFLRHDLRALVTSPAAIVVGRGVPELMRREVETGEPFEELLNPDLTTTVRLWLGELRSGAGIVQEHIRAVRDHVRAVAAHDHFDHAANKQELVDLWDAWKADLDPATLRELRAGGGNPVLICDILGHYTTTAALISLIEHLGVSRKQAVRLATSESAVAHFILGKMALSLHWLMRGDPRSLPEWKASNWWVDLHYGVIGSFCRGGFLEDDGGSRSVAGYLLGAAERRWQYLPV